MSCVKTICKPLSIRCKWRVNSVYERLGTNNKKLIVIVHGLNSGPGSFKPFINDCISTNFDVAAPKFPYWKLASRVPTAQIVTSLNNWIANKIKEKNYESVVLIGHSFGAQIVRSLYAKGWKEQINPKTGSKYSKPVFKVRSGAEWIEKVDRIIYISGLHRGWTLDSFVKRKERFWAGVGNLFGTVAAGTRKLTPSIFAAKPE